MTFISDEDYLTAYKNGIKKQTVRHRVFVAGWPVEKAITEPPIVTGNKPYFTNEEAVLLEKNNISTDTAWTRINVLGWDKERAMSQPVKKRRNNFL